MTDRYNALLVTFEKEIRDDDLQHWVDSLKMFRGVIAVTPACLATSEHYHAKAQARRQLQREMQDVLRQPPQKVPE